MIPVRYDYLEAMFRRLFEAQELARVHGDDALACGIRASIKDYLRHHATAQPSEGVGGG